MIPVPADETDPFRPLRVERLLFKETKGRPDAGHRSVSDGIEQNDPEVAPMVATEAAARSL
jgi:hypothetical protein